MALGGCGDVHVSSGGDADRGEINCSPPSGVQTLKQFADQVCDHKQPALPIPPAADINEILSMLGSVDSQASADESVTGAMSVCVSLLGGASPAEIVPQAQRWFGDGDGKLSSSESSRIVGLIGSQGWCE